MAYRFKGAAANDNIRVGATGSAGTVAQTFCAWIRPISDGENNAGTIHQIAVSGSDAETQRVFRCQAGRAFQLTVRRPANPAHQMTSRTGVLRFFSWQFVAGAWSPTAGEVNALYWGDLTTPPIEVRLASKDIYTALHGADNGDAWIGGRAGSTDNFDGDIAEVGVIYNRALGLSAIRHVWRYGLAYTTYSHYWPLRINAVNWVSGASPVSNTATLVAHVTHSTRPSFLAPQPRRFWGIAAGPQVYTETPTASLTLTGTEVDTRVANETATGTAVLAATAVSSAKVQEVGTGAAVFAPAVDDTVVTGAQKARPISDVSVGGWTNELDGTTNLYASVDEVTPDDVDFIKSILAPSNDEVILVLDTLQTPETRTNHFLRIRYKKHLPAGEQVDLVVRLLENGTERAARSYTDISDVIGTIEIVLTQGEMDSIVNYENLRVAVKANTP